VAREEQYPTRLLSGEVVTLRVKYIGEEYMESKSNTLRAAARGKTGRIRIPQPMSAQPTDQWTPPQPRDMRGERIQVTAHATEQGEIVERWQISESEVWWYRIEIDGRPVMLKRQPSGEQPA
jgi:hypothetical protein